MKSQALHTSQHKHKHVTKGIFFDILHIKQEEITTLNKEYSMKLSHLMRSNIIMLLSINTIMLMKDSNKRILSSAFQKYVMPRYGNTNLIKFKGSNHFSASHTLFHQNGRMFGNAGKCNINIQMNSIKASSSNFNINRTNKLPTSRNIHSTTRLYSKMKNEKVIEEEVDLKRSIKDAKDVIDRNTQSLPKLNVLQNEISDLEQEISDPSFWTSPNAQKVNSELSKKKHRVSRIERWNELYDECVTALSIIDELDVNTDKEDIMLLSNECRDGVVELLDDLEKYELERSLSGPFDSKPARISILAGAGGTEACDWVDMLQRMYVRHAEKMGYMCKIESMTPGDVVGYKSVELLIQSGGEGANYPYGWFQYEKGAHRLVRLSPFNANNKRQTTFAGVDIMPILDDAEVQDIDIPDSDLEMSFLRAGGKGGQNVK